MKQLLLLIPEATASFMKIRVQSRISLQNWSICCSLGDQSRPCRSVSLQIYVNRKLIVRGWGETPISHPISLDARCSKTVLGLRSASATGGHDCIMQIAARPKELQAWNMALGEVVQSDPWNRNRWVSVLVITTAVGSWNCNKVACNSHRCQELVKLL